MPWLSPRRWSNCGGYGKLHNGRGWVKTEKKRKDEWSLLKANQMFHLTSTVSMRRGHRAAGEMMMMCLNFTSSWAAVTGDLGPLAPSFLWPLYASPSISWPKHLCKAQAGGKVVETGEKPSSWLMEGFKAILIPRRQVWLSSKLQQEASCSKARCWVTENLWAWENQDKFSEW